MERPLDVVVGRQPIFDRHMEIMGYELLFRSVGAFVPNGSRALGDQMTADVLFSSINIGIDRLVGDKKLFCNASRGVLVGEVPIVLPPERTVIEVLESVVVDDEVVSGCQRLLDEGYQLALDDFRWSSEMECLLERAQMVKIDIQDTQPSEVAKLIERCRPFGAKLVAEKVTTLDELHRCDQLGFHYAQGYLLARPQQVQGRALDIGKLSRLRMSARLLDTECPISDLEEIVRSDPAMSYQVLQLAGLGAAQGLRRNVKTIHEALVLLGWRRLQSWVSLLLIADKGRVSQEGVTNALTRARMCELISKDLDPSMSDEAFTVGMVSSFDLLLGMPLADVIEGLPLADEIRGALVHGDGFLGHLIADVSDYLLGHPETAVRSGLGEEVMSKASLQALMWAVELTSVFNARPAAQMPSEQWPPAEWD